MKTVKILSLFLIFVVGGCSESSKIQEQTNSPVRLRYYAWRGFSPGADFTHTALSAFEVDFERRKIRKIMRSASHPQPMISHIGADKAIESEPWAELDERRYEKIHKSLDEWLKTNPPKVYSTYGALGYEDGSAVSMTVFYGDGKQHTTSINFRPRDGNLLVPPTEWQALIGAVFGLSTGISDELIDSVFRYFGFTKITKVTVNYAPKGDFAAKDCFSVATTDERVLAEMTDLLKRMPSVGTVYKDFPSDIEQWRIDLIGEPNNKEATLLYYGVCLRSPKSQGEVGTFGLAGEEKLLALIKKIATEKSKKSNIR